MKTPSSPTSFKKGPLVRFFLWGVGWAPPVILRRRSAFSLVEVVIALGLVSFCLLAIVGLLPVGLKAVKNSREESAAANALNQLAEAVRNATTTAPGVYVADGAFTNITWSLGSGSASFTNPLSLYGQTTNSAGSRLVARVDIVPPVDTRSVGRASVSIAWPSAATWSNNAWTQSDGSVSAGIQFLPKQ
jgi:type II secretory pathway pseudopilin PulG